jgi:hypothetical protein
MEQKGRTSLAHLALDNCELWLEPALMSACSLCCSACPAAPYATGW